MGGTDDVGASTGPPRGVRTPAFRRLWWSWTVSLLGDGVRGLALPLFVAIKTGSPLAASAVTAAETFAYSASQALMVGLAGPDQLSEANAKFYTVHTIGLHLAGPLAAGALYTIGPAWAFGLDGV